MTQEEIDNAIIDKKIALKKAQLARKQRDREASYTLPSGKESYDITDEAEANKIPLKLSPEDTLRWYLATDKNEAVKYLNKSNPDKFFLFDNGLLKVGDRNDTPDVNNVRKTRPVDTKWYGELAAGIPEMAGNLAGGAAGVTLGALTGAAPGAFIGGLGGAAAGEAIGRGARTMLGNALGLEQAYTPEQALEAAKFGALAQAVAPVRGISAITKSRGALNEVPGVLPFVTGSAKRAAGLLSDVPAPAISAMANTPFKPWKGSYWKDLWRMLKNDREVWKDAVAREKNDAWKGLSYHLDNMKPVDTGPTREALDKYYDNVRRGKILAPTKATEDALVGTEKDLVDVFSSPQELSLGDNIVPINDTLELPTGMYYAPTPKVIDPYTAQTIKTDLGDMAYFKTTAPISNAANKTAKTSRTIGNIGYGKMSEAMNKAAKNKRNYSRVNSKYSILSKAEKELAKEPSKGSFVPAVLLGSGIGAATSDTPFTNFSDYGKGAIAAFLLRQPAVLGALARTGKGIANPASIAASRYGMSALLNNLQQEKTSITPEWDAAYNTLNKKD